MENNTLHERYFNETSTINHNAYQYSKVLAEKEAWNISRAQSKWDLVAICPGFTVRPTLVRNQGRGGYLPSISFYVDTCWWGVPDLAFAVVDVRDIAEAHVKAAKFDSAHGRYIVAGSGMTSFLEISKLLKSAHAISWYLPTWNIPNWVLYLLGPLTVLTRRWLNANIGIKFSLDNSRSINELGIKYRKAPQSLVDHYYS